MKALQSLRRPANWQDFESLCKKLWGEIWSCPEIQKNGRLGQDQSGVDIFGIPLGEDGYYGIQCKGKSEYNDHHCQFTEAQLLAEIEKAKCFQPPLKKLYFATTALTDSYIQTFVRQKNIEHKVNGLFEIHIFCWEAIVDLIDENKQTHDWYVKQLGYKTNKQVDVTFHDGTKEMTIFPMFKKTTKTYLLKGTDSSIFQESSRHMRILAAFSRPSISSATINKSYSRFAIRLQNTGIDTIEDYKLFFEFDGDLNDLTDTNEADVVRAIVSVHVYNSTILFRKKRSGKAVPKNPILVGDDAFFTEDIFIKPIPKEYSIRLKWKLISRDYKNNGELIINIKPTIEKIREIVIVNDAMEIKDDETEFQDYIVSKTTLANED